MGNYWNFRIISVWDEIYSDSFQKEWLELYESSKGNIFFHPSLSRAWTETYCWQRELRPAFLEAISGDKKILLPLVVWHQNWKNAFRRLLVPVGHSDFDYHDPLFKGDIRTEEWEEFYYELLRLLKSNVCFDSLVISGIHSGSVSGSWSEESDIAPFCKIASFSSPEHFLKSLNTSLRGDIRRQIRRIEAKGSLVLQHIYDINEALKLLPEFLRCHSERWPASYKAPHFHENLLKFGLKSGIVHFSVLKCSDEIISWHLGFISESRYFYYMPAINPEFENFSPGKVHLYMLIEFAFRKGLLIFDHLRGREAYKAGWTNDISRLYKFHYVRNNPYSLTKEFICSVKSHLR